MEMTRQLLWLALCLPLAAVVSVHAKESTWQPNDVAKKVAKLLVEIRQVGDSQAISVNNSEVYVETAAIKRIVDGGPKMLDLLVLGMKDDRIDFDTFTRCYSASDQILHKIDTSSRVLWYGGCSTKDVDKVRRIFPGGQMDEKKFRKQVVQDIEEKMSKLKKEKRP
jgi:hypothetical protein